MAETIEPTTELAAIVDGPECYVRVNIAKNSKGYTHETTISLRWNDIVYPARETGEPENLWVRTLDAWGTPIDSPARVIIEDLLRMSDAEARAEIARREALDAAEKAAVMP